MYKVLIVEDDPMVAMINEQYVKQNADYQVVGTCRDGKTALQFLEENPVDLVILDVYMPGMNGLELLRKMREMQIPGEVIMVTAANDKEAVEEALHGGAVDYLVKPFTADRFQMALAKFSTHKRALDDVEVLNQKSIDYLIDHHHTAGTYLPKGIQESTLQLVIDYIDQHPNKSFTTETVALAIDLTVVTVRRYMNYLSEIGRVTATMNYETGGRPCIMYKKV